MGGGSARGLGYRCGCGIDVELELPKIVRKGWFEKKLY